MPLSQVAGDAVGLMEALGIDRADVLVGSRDGMIARQNGIGSNQETFLPQAEPCPGTLAACEAQLEAFMAFDVDGRLNAISAPTMVIIGNQDVLTPPTNSFLIARRIQGAKIREIERAGHISGPAMRRRLGR